MYNIIRKGKIKMKDARYRKTEAVLREAMIEILAEKPINKISIVEICRSAKINKSTFYLHYTDIFDYYHSLVSSVANDLINIFGKHSYNELISNFSDIFLEALVTIKNDKLMQVMLGKNNNEAVINRVSEAIGEHIISKNPEKSYEKVLINLKTCFITTGTIGIIHKYGDAIFDSPSLATKLANSIQNGFLPE